MAHQAAGSGLGKAAEQLMKEMQQAQEQMEKLQQQSAGPSGGPNAAFQNAMQQSQQTQQAQAVQQASASQRVQESQKASNVLLQAKVDANRPTTRVGEAAKSERSRLASMLDGLIGGQDKMTKIMNMALSGRKFSPQELLAMQAGVYRFSQELELTTKVVEKATSGIKQTMNTQV